MQNLLSRFTELLSSLAIHSAAGDDAETGSNSPPKSAATATKPWVKCSPQQLSLYAVVNDCKAIMFSPCNVISYHPKDVENRYCGFCHRFIGDK